MGGLAMTFRCEACLNTRPAGKIDVLIGDVSKGYDLPKGSATRNVNYCNDNPDCRARASQIMIRAT